MSLTQPLPSTAPKSASATPIAPIAKTQTIKSLPFTKQLGFRRALNERADAYFKATGLPRRDVPAMYVKTIVLFALYLGIFATILISAGAVSPVVTVLLYVAWGFTYAGLGFNVMHDAIHGGYSNHAKVNRILGLSSELLGTSGFVWKQKHNVWHHTYTNIAGLDEDLETQGAFRFSPHEPLKPKHAWQHLYAPFVYAGTGFSFIIRDFRVFFTGHSDQYHNYPKMNAREKTIFLAGKVVFFALTLFVPMLFMPPLLALAGWIISVATISLVLASIFQLAHVMEPATFPEPDGDPLHVENEWAVHEVETTVDFAQHNRILSWYCGGLNFQIEHHLFPLICHVHYPALSKIVRETCAEFGVKYYTYPTWISAIRGHFRTLRALGREAAPVFDPPPSG